MRDHELHYTGVSDITSTPEASAYASQDDLRQPIFVGLGSMAIIETTPVPERIAPTAIRTNWLSKVLGNDASKSLEYFGAHELQPVTSALTNILYHHMTSKRFGVEAFADFKCAEIELLLANQPVISIAEKLGLVSSKVRSDLVTSAKQLKRFTPKYTDTISGALQAARTLHRTTTLSLHPNNNTHTHYVPRALQRDPSELELPPAIDPKHEFLAPPPLPTIRITPNMELPAGQGLLQFSVERYPNLTLQISRCGEHQLVLLKRHFDKDIKADRGVVGHTYLDDVTGTSGTHSLQLTSCKVAHTRNERTSGGNFYTIACFEGINDEVLTVLEHIEEDLSIDSGRRTLFGDSVISPETEEGQLPPA